jgi:arginyl-tRNA synthetase
MKDGSLPEAEIPGAHQVSAPKQEGHGDFASNLAMMMASAAKMAPVKIAGFIREKLTDNALFEKVEVAGPGFLNLFISRSWWQETLPDISRQGAEFGRSDRGKGQKVLIEFVSANPTGPLHVGHGRGAAVGDALARIMSAAGFEVHREYYLNDAGNQMNILGRSVFLRYRELCGEEVDFPGDCYQGDYITDLAGEIVERDGRRYLEESEESSISIFTRYASNRISDIIRKDLEEFGVVFDEWFSEKKLHESGFIAECVDKLAEQGILYEKDGALWFRTSDFGDEKDRVVRRANGILTYFAADIAYHRHKCERGFNILVDIWGADHHGYVPRVRAAMEAQGYPPDMLRVLLIQLVNLLENGEKKSMSTRAGEFVTLREVLDDVGSDAARFIFLTRKCDSKLDFDLDLARSQTQDNPVFYVQYAHARLASVFRNAEQQSIPPVQPEKARVSMLTEPEEIRIIKHVNAFPSVVSESALALEPHRITYFLTELASLIHSYYNKFRFVSDDIELTMARLLMADVCKKVLKQGLELAGVSAPEKM